MLIDCDTCRAPADACTDCVMTVLLQLDPRPVDLDAEEYGAIGALAQAGLVPPLRLVVGVDAGVAGIDSQAQVADDDDQPETGEDEVLDLGDTRRAGGPGLRGIA